jgi:predicted NBD/HSP70 family sugar kinase
LGNREWTPEIGSLLIERDGAMDDFGRRGTLAAYCTPSALQNNAASYGFNPDKVADLWRLASSNFAAQSLVEEFTERLAQGICNLLVALRPPILCIGGEFGRAIWPVLEPNFVFKLREFTPTRVLEGLELRGSTLDKDAGAWGALALGLASANSQSAALAYSPPAR